MVWDVAEAALREGKVVEVLEGGPVGLDPGEGIVVWGSGGLGQEKWIPLGMRLEGRYLCSL